MDAQGRYQNLPSTKGLMNLLHLEKKKNEKVHDFPGQSRQCSLGPNPKAPPCPLWLPRVRAWKGRRVAAAAAAAKSTLPFHFRGFSSGATRAGGLRLPTRILGLRSASRAECGGWEANHRHLPFLG